MLVAASGSLAATLPHGVQTVVFGAAAVVGAYFVAWDAVKSRRLRREPAHVQTARSLPHKSLVITPRGMGTFAVMSSGEPHYRGLIEVRVRAYVANQSDSAPATLSTARAAIQLDNYPIDLVETHVGQFAPRGGEIPEGYTYPPVVQTGATLEIECVFFTHTQGSPAGGWIHPHGGVLVGFTLIDLFGVESRLPTNIEFSVSAFGPKILSGQNLR